MKRTIIIIILALFVGGMVGCATIGTIFDKLGKAANGQGAETSGQKFEEPAEGIVNGFANTLIAILGSTTLGSAGIGIYKAAKKNKEISNKQEMKQAYVQIIQELRNSIPKAKESMDSVVADVLSKADMTLAAYQSQVQADKASANITKPKA